MKNKKLDENMIKFLLILYKNQVLRVSKNSNEYIHTGRFRHLKNALDIKDIIVMDKNNDVSMFNMIIKYKNLGSRCISMYEVSESLVICVALSTKKFRSIDAMRKKLMSYQKIVAWLGPWLESNNIHISQEKDKHNEKTT